MKKYQTASKSHFQGKSIFWKNYRRFSWFNQSSCSLRMTRMRFVFEKKNPTLNHQLLGAVLAPKPQENITFVQICPKRGKFSRTPYLATPGIKFQKAPFDSILFGKIVDNHRRWRKNQKFRFFHIFGPKKGVRRQIACFWGWGNLTGWYWKTLYRKMIFLESLFFFPSEKIFRTISKILSSVTKNFPWGK